MKVSIITVTYNSEKSLQRSIDSVISQDYPNIEHILIDGGSTDNTVGIIKKNIEHISKYISDRNGGQGCVRDVIEQALRLHKNWMDYEAFSW